MLFSAPAVALHAPALVDTNRWSLPSLTHSTSPDPAWHESRTRFSQLASAWHSAAVEPPDDRNTESYLAVHTISGSCGEVVGVDVGDEVAELVGVVVVVCEVVGVVVAVVDRVVVAVEVADVVGVEVADVVGVLTWHVWNPPCWYARIMALIVLAEHVFWSKR